MNKPKPPLWRIVKEGTTGDCPICKSTMLKKHEWVFFIWVKQLDVFSLNVRTTLITLKIKEIGF
jgi:hypothetical protein